MSKHARLLTKILSGSSDTDIRFSELRHLLISLGFQERVKGSHHIFTKNGVQEILNIQSKTSKAKPYQVKQIRNVLITYRLNLNRDEES